MAIRNLRRRIVEKLNNRYRLIMFNDTTYQSVFSMKLTRIKAFTLSSLLLAFWIFLVTMLIATTSLKEYIPGYPKAEFREMLIHNAIMVDSLENELRARDEFFKNISTIVSGGVPTGITPNDDSLGITGQVHFKAYNHDSVFQDKILEERLSLSSQAGSREVGNPSNLHFFLPVKGLVTNKFNTQKAHYGIDLVSQPNSRISATLSGSVLFAGWTQDTGYVIYLLHSNNMVSAYKHNAELLKKVGDRVKAGEAIAIIGNSGEQTTGPHLHFELWYNGKPIDPEQYIVF